MLIGLIRASFDKGFDKKGFVHGRLVVIFLKLDICKVAGKQKLCLILLLVKRCKCNGYVQSDILSGEKLSVKLRSVFVAVINKKQACSLFIGPKGRSLFPLLQAANSTR